MINEVVDEAERKRLYQARVKKDIKRYTSYVNNYSNTILRPQPDLQYTKIPNTNTWFNIEKHDMQNPEFNYKQVNIKPPKKKQKIPYRTIQVKLLLSANQRKVIDRWFNACILTYNETIKYLETINRIPSFISLRKLLSKKRDMYKLRSKPFKSAHIDTIIPTHILDESIKEARTNFKNAKEVNGIVKPKFFLEKTKVMHIEADFFNPTSVFRLQVNAAIYENQPYNLDDIYNIHGSTCIIQKYYNIYYMFIPILVIVKDSHPRKNFIAGDLGSRKFMTAYADGEILKIGEGIHDTMSKCITREKQSRQIMKQELNKKSELLKLNQTPEIKTEIKKSKLNIKRLSKNSKQCKKRMLNLSNELHWKTANYLTANYKNIIIGDIKVSQIVKKKNNLPKIVKKVMLKLRFYKFKQRLKYKCQANNCNYIAVGEAYTTQMCSQCGERNLNVGASKIFTCAKCHSNLDRDVNASINILIRYYGENK